VIQENIGKDKINKKVEFNHEIGMIKKQIYKIKKYEISIRLGILLRS